MFKQPLMILGLNSWGDLDSASLGGTFLSLKCNAGCSAFHISHEVQFHCENESNLFKSIFSPLYNFDSVARIGICKRI